MATDSYKDCPKCREDVEPMVEGDPVKFKMDGRIWLKISCECPLCGHKWDARVPEDEYEG